MGHSKDSVGREALVRVFDDEAFALVVGSAWVRLEGEAGGESPAACNVLAGSSQKFSLSFSGFQW